MLFFVLVWIWPDFTENSHQAQVYFLYSFSNYWTMLAVTKRVATVLPLLPVLLCGLILALCWYGISSIHKSDFPKLCFFFSFFNAISLYSHSLLDLVFPLQRLLLPEMEIWLCRGKAYFTIIPPRNRAGYCKLKSFVTQLPNDKSASLTIHCQRTGSFLCIIVIWKWIVIVHLLQTQFH